MSEPLPLETSGNTPEYSVSEIAGGDHGYGSLHYRGRAIDIASINGRRVGNGARKLRAVQAVKRRASWSGRCQPRPILHLCRRDGAENTLLAATKRLAAKG